MAKQIVKYLRCNRIKHHEETVIEGFPSVSDYRKMTVLFTVLGPRVLMGAASILSFLTDAPQPEAGGVYFVDRGPWA